MIDGFVYWFLESEASHEALGHEWDASFAGVKAPADLALRRRFNEAIEGLFVFGCYAEVKDWADALTDHACHVDEWAALVEGSMGTPGFVQKVLAWSMVAWAEAAG